MSIVIRRCYICRKMYLQEYMRKVVVKDSDDRGFETKVCQNCIEDLNGTKEDDNAASSKTREDKST